MSHEDEIAIGEEHYDAIAVATGAGLPQFRIPHDRRAESGKGGRAGARGGNGLVTPRHLLLMVALVLACRCGQRERDITVGSDRDTSGNYWGRNVSKEFGEPQLNTLYKTMNSPATAAEIRDLNCGKVLPRHEYSVTLWTEGAYRERQVRLQMTPRLYADDECLQQSVDYIFQRHVKAIDPGPPIDYGYKDPRTGKHLDTKEIAKYLPPKPECSCSKSP